MSQISAVKQQLQYGPAMDGDNKTSSQELKGIRIAKQINGRTLFGSPTA